MLKEENVRYIIVHGTKRNMTRDQLERVHRLEGRFGIGHHFVIERSGRVYPGRPLTEPGNHTSGYNDKSIGIVVIGNGKHTPRQKEALRELVESLIEQFTCIQEIALHSDIDPTMSYCPGSTKKELRIDDLARRVASHRA